MVSTSPPRPTERRTRMRRLVMLVATACAPIPLQGRSPSLVTVRGLAYDSLHIRPLTGAFIVLAGTSRSATSDSAGRFAFDSVTPGPHRFVMQHDVLDSIGMSGAVAQVSVTDGRDTIRVAIPSFGTLWRAACPSPMAPSDSSLVFGTIRAPGGRSSAGA